MRRRKFISLLGGAAAAVPLAASAQQAKHPLVAIITLASNAAASTRRILRDNFLKLGIQPGRFFLAKGLTTSITAAPATSR
jgi:hypothetical protein